MARWLLRQWNPVRQRQTFLAVVRRQTDFVIVQVAGWVFRPGIAGELPGPHPRVAAADIEVLADTAAAMNRTRLLPEAGHEVVARVRPDLGERPLLDVAQ